MDLLQAVLITALVFTVPGAALAWVSGLRLPWALASSIPVSFGTFGLVGWLLGVIGWRFDTPSYLLIYAGLFLLAVVWRLGFILVGRRRHRPVPAVESEAEAEPSEPVETVPETPAGSTAASIRGEGENRREGGILDPAWLLPAAGVFTGIWLFLSQGFRFLEMAPGQLENIVQGWDVHWHASMVRWIMDEGIADPTRMGELRNIETAADLYYPSAWHTGAYLAADLVGLSPIAAINMTSIVLPGMALPLSAAMIAWKMVGNRGLTAQLAAGIAGIAIFASPVLMWIGTYVGAWPYLGAIAVSGTVLALFMHVPYRPIAAFAAAVSFTGLVQLHPSAVTILLMVLALWWLLHLVWAPARRYTSVAGKIGARFRDLGWLALAGGVGTVVLLPQLLSGSEATEEVSSFTAYEDVTREESWLKSIYMQTRHIDAFPDFDPTLLLWLAGIGGVALILWRRNLWAPIFYGLSVWLTANSLMPFAEPWNEWLDIIGSLHYSTAHRLVMPVALFTFAAAGVGVAVIIRLLSLAPVKKWAPWTTVVSIILGLVAGWGTVRWATADEVLEGAEWGINGPRLDGRMVSDVDLRAFDWLAQQPGAYDGLIMGEPADGHGWMYAYNSLPSVMRHYLWPDAKPGTDTELLYWHGDLLGVGNNDDPEQTNTVDQAAKDLDVRFFYVSPWNFWDFQEPHLPLIDGLWLTPGVTPVYREANVAIFAVNEAFTDAEIEQMRAPGNSPEPLPPLPTDETGAETIHRPTKPDLGGPNPLQTPGNPDTPPVEIPATRP